ncbi:MAG: hemerythrin family protein [Gammaproteobacteria bacterium]|nr:hemerythrin family protein [Gammaproteobacteria bacterium]
MGLIDWKDEFSIGVPAVDFEHQQLVALINDGYTRFSNGESGFSIDDFLGEIFTQISSHFALEESEMVHRKYDQYKEHKQDHERLLDQIRDVMDAYDDDGSFDKEALGAYLAKWFTGHFKTKDARFHGHLDVGS